jgi:hypothetical protein
MTSYSQLESLWTQAGGPSKDAALMAAIAEAESGGNPSALNPNDNNGTQSSFGLWQISNGTHTPPASNWSNPLENAKLAVQKFFSQGLGAWGTYTSGAYKKFLNGSVPGNPGGGTGGGSGGSGSGSGSGSGTGTGGGITLTSAAGCPNFVQNPLGWIFCNAATSVSSSQFGNFLTDPVDMAERAGLVVLGAVMVILGIAILGFGPLASALGMSAGVASKSRSISRGFSSDSGGGGASGPSEASVEDKKRRTAIAEGNLKLGQQKQAFRESRESRLAATRKIPKIPIE